MKWFKHDSDAHDNLKFQELLSQYKMIGYGVWWICCELVSQNLDVKKPVFSISKKKNWLKKLGKVSGISIPTLERILQILAESDLISKKALKIGSLSIPQMKERCDEYTERIIINSRQTHDKLPTKYPLIEEKRIEEKRGEVSSLKPFYKNEEMRKKDGKWFVIPKIGGGWLEFAGDPKKDIIWK